MRPWFIRICPLKYMISGIPNIQAKTSGILCLNFGESRFLSCCKIPFPIKIYCVFLNPTPYMYFGQITESKNTHQDPVGTV